ncbi:dihydropteroate synthase [Alphaproteobacteria bacterium KMM 3653]|uniref:dihydropteroate synthase n=1 Tax=Harenicola maris TaxID=2841044 RepID=A0AAP2CRX4_9RHOB|nr:dihydropteroate synthase [Harenicola maris]
MSLYYRAIAMTDAARPEGALPLAGGWCWFDRVEVLERGRAPQVIAADQAPAEVLQAMSAPRAPLMGKALERPLTMGILNVTPDSFSDGGTFAAPEAALAGARALARDCDILDIGGESTRPGAETVPVAEEVARTAPVIAALRAGGLDVPVSIDTRKAGVGRAALEAGADMLNDVSGLSYDGDMAAVAAQSGAPICLMHAQGDPATMQQDPRYDDVLLDVYDYLAGRVEAARSAGIGRQQIVLDPGIGFGKTLEHNLSLLRRMSLFHSLGCPLLVGASRKRFIGTIGGAEEAQARLGGSVAVAIGAAMQGVQIIRAHDTFETTQALRLMMAQT